MVERITEQAANLGRKLGTAAVVAVLAVLAVATVFAVSRLTEIFFVVAAAALVTLSGQRLLARNRALKTEVKALEAALADTKTLAATQAATIARHEETGRRALLAVDPHDGEIVRMSRRERANRAIPGEPPPPRVA